jgi:hypothetical protein
MPDGNIASQSVQGQIVYGLGNQTHARVKADSFTIGSGDAGALLTPMLKGI